MQKRFDIGTRQGDGKGRIQPAFPRRGGGGIAHKTGQPAHLVFAQRQDEILLIGQNILRKFRAQGRQSLANFIELRPIRALQHGALAHEIQVIAFEHPHRFGVQPKRFAFGEKRVNAGEQIGVQVDRAPMGRQARRHFQLDRLQRVIGMSRCEIGENCFDLAQQLAAFLQRDDGALETGRRGGDGGNLGVMLRQGAVIGRREMLRRDAVQRRGAERGGPVFEKRIVHPGNIGAFSGFPRRWKPRR